MNNNKQEGVAAIARDESAIACPIQVGSVFTTATHGDTVMALEINQRKPDVWSVRIVDAVRNGKGWDAAGNERWTSIKVTPAGRSRIEVLNA